MSDETTKPKRFLFVDDDAGFLAGIHGVFSELARGSWEIFTGENHAQALAQMQKQPMDVVVLDLDMPVMDGLQFLRLLGRTHPGQVVAILTGAAPPEARKACLEAGAALFLEKPVSQEGFAAAYSALDALAGALPQEGFRGMMRRVGLHEVLQMECLSRKSSVLDIFTNAVRGRIFICDGGIVHAESGALQGEVALYGLLALRGGEFNLLPFTEPPRRTISGHWESLLMEAARLSDEGTTTFARQAAEKAAVEVLPESAAPDLGKAAAPSAPIHRVCIEEIVLCSGAGEVLYEWECRSLERRLKLLEQVEQQGTQLSGLAPIGRFVRLEVLTTDGRLVCETQPHRRLLVRSASLKVGRQ
jgi:CheY-like chemotaxis protein